MKKTATILHDYFGIPFAILIALCFWVPAPAQDIQLRIDPEYYPLRWKNNTDVIILLDDFRCEFRQDLHWVDGEDTSKKRKNRPLVYHRQGEYRFTTYLITTYRIADDTLIISFDGAPDNLYKIDGKGLTFIRNGSSGLYAHKRGKLRASSSVPMSFRPAVTRSTILWKNNSDRIITLNDSMCLFQQDRIKVKANRRTYSDKDGVIYGVHGEYYMYREERKARYEIVKDTLIVTFIAIPSDPAQDRQNHYLIKPDRSIYYLPGQSLSRFGHKTKTLRRVQLILS